jgi:hypothetical protein
MYGAGEAGEARYDERGRATPELDALYTKKRETDERRFMLYQEANRQAPRYRFTVEQLVTLLIAVVQTYVEHAPNAILYPVDANSALIAEVIESILNALDSEKALVSAGHELPSMQEIDSLNTTYLWSRQGVPANILDMFKRNVETKS